MKKKEFMDVDKKIEKILLQSTYSPTHPLIFKFPGVKRIYIAGPDVHFFEQLRALPADIRIRLMALPWEDMEVFIAAEKKLLSQKIEHFLNAKWHDRSSGEPVSFKEAWINEIYFKLKLTDKEIIKKAKAGKLTTEQQKLIVKMFESGDEVYQLEQNQIETI